MKGHSSKKSNKSDNRLKFKKHKSQKKNIKKDIVKDVLDAYYDQTEQETKENGNTREHSIDDEPHYRAFNESEIHLEEWGPSINGYRFVNTHTADAFKSKNYYHQRHNLAYGKKNGMDAPFEWSYEDLPKFKFNGYDYLNERYSKTDNDNEDWNYDIYLKYWIKAKNNEIDDVILKFPIFPNEELNSSNIESFFKSSKEESFNKILKRERIRWHPDKMFQLLPKSANYDVLKTQELIKFAFQCINELWEKFNDKSK